MIPSFITAFRTLTIIPLPGRNAADFSHSLVFFPLVGAFIAEAEYAVMVAGNHLLPHYPLITAYFMVFSGVLLTGAIHCDGLADFCDGFFGGKNREHILSIMKDPRSGTFGIIALIMDLGFRFLACYILITGKAFYVIAFSLVISRIVQAICIAFLPYARKEGGTAAPFFGARISKWRVIFVLVVSYLIGSAFSGLSITGTHFLCGITVTMIFLFFCKKKIGGITGDCIGACSEISENSVLLCGLFFLGRTY